MLASDVNAYRLLWELAWWAIKATLALATVALLVAAVLVGLLTLLRRERGDRADEP